MSKEILNKYKGVKIIVNDEVAKAMSMAVSTDTNTFALQQMFAMSDNGGDIIVCADKDQAAILELVVGQAAADSAITLYAPHPVFASPGTLLKAREEVIGAIRRHRPEALMLNDPIRSRAAFLTELGFAQLIDTLRAIENPVAEAA